jgi:hypothetical protein
MPADQNGPCSGRRLVANFCSIKSNEPILFGPIPYMPLKNILVPYMSLAPHVIDTKKYIYMSLTLHQNA